MKAKVNILDQRKSPENLLLAGLHYEEMLKKLHLKGKLYR